MAAQQLMKVTGEATNDATIRHMKISYSAADHQTNAILYIIITAMNHGVRDVYQYVTTAATKWPKSFTYHAKW